MARIKAHFDGKVFVPDEPVDFRAGEPVELDVSSANAPKANGAGTNGLDPTRFIRSFTAPVHPPEAYRRENLYRDDV